MASFINGIIIGTEEEEGYNEVVEKVIKRLAENNIYVKPTKYGWKVKEVESSLLFSLIPSSCMIAPNRELANILNLFDFRLLPISQTQYHMNANMEIDTLRDRSTNSSSNSSKISFVLLKLSFIKYIEQIQALNNKLT